MFTQMSVGSETSDLKIYNGILSHTEALIKLVFPIWIQT